MNKTIKLYKSKLANVSLGKYILKNLGMWLPEDSLQTDARLAPVTFARAFLMILIWG